MSHAIERALQRYNKEYTTRDLVKIRENIRHGKIVGQAFKPPNDDVNMLVYTMYKHIPLKVLYNPVSYYIITLFPFDFNEFDKIQ